MRAAASKFPARARTWQSQRTTRRSLLRPASDAPTPAPIVFQPVPAHSGQVSDCAFLVLALASSILLNSIELNRPLPKFYSPTLHSHTSFLQAVSSGYLCTTCAAAKRPVEVIGKRSFQLP